MIDRVVVYGLGSEQSPPQPPQHPPCAGTVLVHRRGDALLRPLEPELVLNVAALSASVVRACGATSL